MGEIRVKTEAPQEMTRGELLAIANQIVELLDLVPAHQRYMAEAIVAYLKKAPKETAQ